MLTSPSQAYQLSGYKDCTIVSTGFVAYNDLYAFAFQKGSPYTQLFNNIMAKMTESGELKRIIGRYLSTASYQTTTTCQGHSDPSLGIRTLVEGIRVKLYFKHEWMLVDCWLHPTGFQYERMMITSQ